MIARSRSVPREELEAGTGWAIKAEGACKGDVCVLLPADLDRERPDLAVVGERLRMPLVEDLERGLYCLGPESGGHALTSAACPDLRLPDWHGDAFDLASLRGRKVLLLAWASW